MIGWVALGAGAACIVGLAAILVILYSSTNAQMEALRKTMKAQNKQLFELERRLSKRN